MNFVYLLIEVIVIYLLMILFYRFGKKEGLYLYIGLMSSVLAISMFELIDIFSFQIDIVIPLIMGIFICSNIILQRYGLDETNKIIKFFTIPYLAVITTIGFYALIGTSEYTSETGISFNNLFSYDLSNFRIVIGYLLSIGLMLWYNSYMYYYIRKNKNKLLFSNIGTTLIIQFVESIIFVVISYFGEFDINVIFSIIIIRYLLKVIMGIIGLIPVNVIIKMKDK
ncbi:MAG: VUT family protein [Bacilli bacterium]|nr:VUT family protein [Bacilli bacterium]